MGARIEIIYILIIDYNNMVAPLVGARIEILSSIQTDKRNKSLPSWERGLKLQFVKS